MATIITVLLLFSGYLSYLVIRWQCRWYRLKDQLYDTAQLVEVKLRGSHLNLPEQRYALLNGVHSAIREIRELMNRIEKEVA